MTVAQASTYSVGSFETFRAAADFAQEIATQLECIVEVKRSELGEGFVVIAPIEKAGDIRDLEEWIANDGDVSWGPDEDDDDSDNFGADDHYQEMVELQVDRHDREQETFWENGEN